MSHNPRLAAYNPNGGTDPRTMFVTPRKFNGWGAECGVHVQNLLSQRPSRLVWHLTHGTRNKDAMEADGVVWARIAAAGGSEPYGVRPAPELKHMVNEDEFLGAMLTLHAMDPEIQHDFYIGAFAASEIFTDAWNKENFTQWENRIDSSIRPYTKLKARGVKVGLWHDAMCMFTKDSQDARAFWYIREKHGIKNGIETRPLKVADWANRPDIPCITIRYYWHEMNGHANAIPEKELLGEQWLICEKPDEAQAEYDAGRSVAFIGSWSPSTPQSASEPTSGPPQTDQAPPSPCTS